GAGTLHVLPAGTPAGDPAEILGSPRWHELLRSLAKRYDTVVIDGPAVLAAADAAPLAAAADAVLLVVRGHRTERPVVRRALDRRRFLRDEAPERVAEAVTAREAHDRALAVGAHLDEMDLDVEVLDLREVIAQRARLLVGGHLAKAAQRLDVVRAPGGGVAI